MDSHTTLIAYWGATLSTLLALAKFWDLWSNRQRIETLFDRGSADEGHKIIINNLSNKPLVINYWMVQFFVPSKSIWTRDKKNKFIEVDPLDIQIIPIGGNSSISIQLKGEGRYFDLNTEDIKGNKIKLLLAIAGKKGGFYKSLGYA